MNTLWILSFMIFCILLSFGDIFNYFWGLL